MFKGLLSSIILYGNRYVRKILERSGMMFLLRMGTTGNSPSFPHLESFERCGTSTVRVLGLNPGPHTLQGTNTYLIGTGPEKILVDTGEHETATKYVSFLLDTIFSETDTRSLCIILLTHRHHDHVGGVRCLLDELLKRGLSLPKVYIRHTEESVDAMKSEGLDTMNIIDGQVFVCEGATLKAIYSPGHCSDHVSFIVQEDRALLCGDCILGISNSLRQSISDICTHHSLAHCCMEGCGSAVFDDLLLLMKSLQRINELFNDVDTSKRLNSLYPGHGPVLRNDSAVAKIEEYVRHRNLREHQILELLEERGTFLSSWEIVQTLYPVQQYSLVLRIAAQVNITHHLVKLHCEDRVIKTWPDQWAMKSD